MQLPNNVEIPSDPYPELRPVLQAFADGMELALGANLAGLYLVGSLATGDFDLDSDVDFLALVKQDLSGGEQAALQALLRIDLMLTDIGITAQELGSIRSSLRILYAEKDMVKEEHILEIGRLVPGAEVRRIEHCNHMNILHQEEAVLDIRRYFLE